MKIIFEWEIIKKNTQRAMVPGGWIVRTIIGSSSPMGGVSDAVAMVFVPDPNHEWIIE